VAQMVGQAKFHRPKRRTPKTVDCGAGLLAGHVGIVPMFLCSVARRGRVRLHAARDQNKPIE
jgi:hypothetical protein